MAKIEVPFDQYMQQATAALTRDGALITSLDATGRPNTMTIGWGTLGVIWGKPIYVALVRPSRYTYGCLEATGDFTVNIPYPEQDEALVFCGTQSGRDHDKFAECGFTVLPSATVKSPGIGECGLIYECRIVHKNDVVPASLAPDITAYPRGDYHRMYSGEILAVRALPDAAALLKQG